MGHAVCSNVKCINLTPSVELEVLEVEAGRQEVEEQEEG